MTLKTLEKLSEQNGIIVNTGIWDAVSKNPDVAKDINDCLDRFFAGDYGNVEQDTIELNNKSLNEGEGNVLAVYELSKNIPEPINIESVFSESGKESNYTVITLASER